MTVKKLIDLLEGTELSHEAKSVIQEAWDKNLSEAREQITAELREEFAQRYAHDKSQVVEAVESFITSRLTDEIQELAEDKKALAKERVKYRQSVKEHARVLDRFVTQMLTKEVKELRKDRSRVAEHVSKLEGFVTEQLAEELREFHQDKQALVEHKVKMVKEGKRELTEAKKTFIKKAAATVEETINRVISEEVKSLRNDITSARENDFGRRIFEAFAAEYNTSYLTEASEIRKVQKSLKEVKKQLAETQAQLQEKDQAVKLTESQLRVAKDKLVRSRKLDELMRPLGRDKREVMHSLLESIQTDKLEQAFNKYLPSVLDGSPDRVKKPLNESNLKKEHTGNKQAAAPVAEADDSADVVELNAIRKLAGLSK